MTKKCSVVISPNPERTSERIDFNGNIIDPRTKQIIVPKEEEYTPPSPPAVPPTTPPGGTTALPAGSVVDGDGLSVLQQIQATKQRLHELEELKKLKIAEKKAELELLEQ